MSTSKEIKRRIKSIKNTKKITKAMELVAASKMRRAVSNTLASRTYARYAWEILQSLSAKERSFTHPLLVERPVKKVLAVVISSDRGLCGSYNSNAIKKALRTVSELEEQHEVSYITIGKKAEAAMRRRGKDIVSSFVGLPDAITLKDAQPIAKLIFESYANGSYDRVMIIYTDFVSALQQTPHVVQLLPVSMRELEETIDRLDNETKEQWQSESIEYLFEPGYEKLMSVMVEKLSLMQIYQMLLESYASEFSSRMIAMKNASEAADEMIDDLTLIFNKARQAGITQEISEISAGMVAVE